MEQTALTALKEKRSHTLNSVKFQITELRAAKDHVTHTEAQLRKVQKRYELLDRKIFQMEHEERIALESEKATRATRAKSPKAKPSLSDKLSNILNDLSEDQLKALLAKHIG